MALGGDRVVGWAFRFRLCQFCHPAQSRPGRLGRSLVLVGLRRYGTVLADLRHGGNGTGRVGCARDGAGAGNKRVPEDPERRRFSIKPPTLVSWAWLPWPERSAYGAHAGILQWWPWRCPLKICRPSWRGIASRKFLICTWGRRCPGAFMRRVVQSVNGLKPDMVAVTGDLVDGSTEHLAEHVEPLRYLSSADGTFCDR